jgi:hypothetical protein
VKDDKGKEEVRRYLDSKEDRKSAGTQEIWVKDKCTSPTLRGLLKLGVFLVIKICFGFRILCFVNQSYVQLIRRDISRRMAYFVPLLLLIWVPSAYAPGSTSALWLIVLSPYWTFKLSPPVPRCQAP